MSTYKLMLARQQADEAFYDRVCTVQVVETSEGPGTLTLGLAVSRSGNDLTGVSDKRLWPYASIAVVATPDRGPSECIFDGYVVSHQVQLDAGLTDAKLDVTCHDASVMMALTPRARHRTGTAATIAKEIFCQYGIKPAPENAREDSPMYTADGQSLSQNESDIEFLRGLARRSGRWCRVTCKDRPGERTGFFAHPSFDSEPVLKIDLSHPERSQVDQLDFHWDVERPTRVVISQASDTASQPQGVSSNTSDSGLPPLDAQTLATFAGLDREVLVTSTATTAELLERARAVLRETERFARCEGTTDVSVLGQVLRVGSVVAVQNVGALLSGKYLVENVTHTITRQCHQMAFSLTRNAVGPATVNGSAP
jgi:phage protein D